MNFRIGKTSAQSNQNYMSYTPNGFEATQQPVAGRSKIQQVLSNKQNLWRIALLAGFLILLAFIPRIILSRNSGSAVKGTNTTTSTLAINKKFTFNGRTIDEKIVDKKPVSMTLKSVGLSQSILIKGQPATARDGKTFLILDIDLDNPYQESYYLPVYNLIRRYDGDKFYAPDVHNGLVLIDPISTKSTRVGFLVDAKVHTFTLKVGEINGEKQTIDIKL